MKPLRISRETAARSESLTKAQDACFVALQRLIEAQEILVKNQDHLTLTLERLAQLWGRSPN